MSGAPSEATVTVVAESAAVPRFLMVLPAISEMNSRDRSRSRDSGRDASGLSIWSRRKVGDEGREIAVERRSRSPMVRSPPSSARSRTPQQHAGLRMTHNRHQSQRRSRAADVASDHTCDDHRRQSHGRNLRSQPAAQANRNTTQGSSNSSNFIAVASPVSLPGLSSCEFGQPPPSTRLHRATMPPAALRRSAERCLHQRLTIVPVSLLDERWPYRCAC